MWPNPQETADLVTFTEETLQGKFHFLCSAKNDDYSTNWKNNIDQIITRDRVIDDNLKRQIKNWTLHTFELHYHKEKSICREQIIPIKLQFSLY